ncbi:hypothetical protein B0H17DRAFT_1175812 [Mycena rosella]|uniref:Uncharacterized protein n=1 Tax=Mycena rosella TaxID=1033263 RepID=A0AAD7GRK3_MYCRO|nr:hypothetical protein B0H17DRAFT_1175812 [Mycena rosella]
MVRASTTGKAAAVKKKPSNRIKTPITKAKPAKKKAAQGGLNTCCVVMEEHLEHVARPTLRAADFRPYDLGGRLLVKFLTLLNTEDLLAGPVIAVADASFLCISLSIWALDSKRQQRRLSEYSGCLKDLGLIPYILPTFKCRAPAPPAPHTQHAAAAFLCTLDFSLLLPAGAWLSTTALLTTPPPPRARRPPLAGAAARGEGLPLRVLSRRTQQLK